MFIRYISDKFEKAIAIQILEQDPSINESLNFRARSGFYIYSAASPELGEDFLYLRGYEVWSDQDQVLVMNFNDNNERDKYYDTLIDALKELEELEELEENQ